MRLLITLPLLTACATSPVYQTAQHVNSTVNKRIVFIHDAEQYGVVDKWVVNPAKGDCEDFALTKIAELQAAGVPASLGVCLGGVGWHAVTLVQDGAETWVLDNLYNYPVRKADYTECNVWLSPEFVRRLANSRKLSSAKAGL